MKQQRWIFVGIIALVAVIVACVLGYQALQQFSVIGSSKVSKPTNAVDVTLIYAPEEELYITEAITNFNRLSARGLDPVTGKGVTAGERPIWIEGKSGSSGTMARGIINAVIAPNNSNVQKPVIFSPSVRHWLALVNYETGRPIFDVDGSPGTAEAPVVMAIWQSRLDAIKAKNPGKDIGWAEILQVLNSPNGWQDYGISGRSKVYYGHTDPQVSSTGLSTLMAEFYASSGNTTNKLSKSQVNDPKVQDGVRKLEGLIKHYSARTTEFKEYIAQGPEYLDFVALEENDLIYINQGKTAYKPPEKLVALYPKEGTFIHDHPFAIPNNVDWVTDEQRKAAKKFTDYVLTKEVQVKILESGFRPVNKEVPLACPICPENGVDPSQPKTRLPVPDPDVLSAILQSWQLVKKQADILLVIDTSGSMNDADKITQAKAAAKTFIEDQVGNNNVGLLQFNTSTEMVLPIAGLESNRAQLASAIDGLEARGNTALYAALLTAIDELSKTSDPSRIQAIVLLSDGQNTVENFRLNDVVSKIQEVRNGKAPILVIPVAYGSDADITALSAIARASDTKVQPGDPKTIRALLEQISQYF